MADGSITFKTDLDNSDLERQLRKAEQRVESLKNRLENAQIDRNVIERQMERANAAIEKTEQKIAELKSQQPTGDISSMDSGQLARYTEITKQINEQYSVLEGQRAKVAQLDEAWHKANDKVVSYTDALEHANARQSNLSAQVRAQAAQSTPAWQTMVETVRAKFSELGNSVRERMNAAASAAITPWQQFSHRLRSMLSFAFLFSTIQRGLGAIKNAIGSILMKNKQFSASVANLKAVLNGFLGGMVQAVLPVLLTVVNTISALFEKLAGFIDKFFGTNLLGGIQQARASAGEGIQQQNAAAQSDYDAKVAEEQARYERELAAAQEKQAKAAKKLEKAQKKANRQVMAFDELNKLTEESTEDAADAMEDYADGIEPPDYSGIEAPDLADDWTQAVGGMGENVFKPLLDWLDMLRDRIENDVMGPFARIREGLMLMKQGWDELVEGIRTGNIGLILAGIRDMFLGLVFVVEGSINAFLGWLDEITGGRFHDIFEGMQTVVHGFAEVIAGILTLDLPRVFEGLILMVEGLSQTLHGIIDAVSGFVRAGVNGIFDYLSQKIPAMAPIFQGLKTLVNGIIQAIVDFAHSNIDGLKQFIEGVLEVIYGLVTLDADKIKSGIKGMADGLITIVRGLRDSVNNIFKAIFDFMRNAADGAFKALALQFPELAGLFMGLRDNVLEIISVIEGTVRGVVDGLSTFIEGALSGLGEIINGALDTIVGIFTLDGERVVEGIKGVLNGATAIFEAALNGIVGGAVDILNGIIGGVNYIPGVDIPYVEAPWISVPRLATGAVIPPNREFMAVLGDQRRGTNIETPESLMRQVVREETGPLLADMVSAIVNANFGTRQGDVVLMVGRKELARETMRGIGELQDTGELGSGIVFA